MSHDHDHDHAHAGHDHGKKAGTTRLVLAILFNALMATAEVVAGLVAGSLTLLADAAHNASDTASMGVSLAARHVAQREADDRRTFGYERAELIGAFVNLVTLVVIALYLLVEAGQRFFEPGSVDGRLMVIVGGITLVGNVLTAVVLYKPSQDSLNVKSAFVHIVADALGSVAVLLGGWLIARYGWTVVDPLLTTAIAVYILAHSYGMLRETISILMESTPRGFPLEAMTATIEAIDHVAGVHHVHVWRLDERRTANGERRWKPTWSSRASANWRHSTGSRAPSSSGSSTSTTSATQRWNWSMGPARTTATRRRPPRRFRNQATLIQPMEVNEGAPLYPGDGKPSGIRGSGIRGSGILLPQRADSPQQIPHPVSRSVAPDETEILGDTLSCWGLRTQTTHAAP